MSKRYDKLLRKIHSKNLNFFTSNEALFVVIQNAGELSIVLGAEATGSSLSFIFLSKEVTFFVEMPPIWIAFAFHYEKMKTNETHSTFHHFA